MSLGGSRHDNNAVHAGHNLTPASTRTHIASACLPCRQRRCKCSGGLPCSKCKSLGIECRYNAYGDKRTKATRERDREELELLRKIVDGIFQAIRGNDQYDILPLIKRHAPLSTIATALAKEMSSSKEMGANTQGLPDAEKEQVLLSTIHTLSEFSGSGNTSPSLVASESNPVHPENKPFEAGTRVKDSLEATLNYISSPDDTQSIRAVPDSQLDQRYLKQPLHGEDPSPLHYLSSLYVKFRDASQHMNLQDIPKSDSHWNDSVACDLLFRERDSSDLFSVSTWAAAVVNNFPELDLFFRLAWLVLLTRFMRWSIALSKESFDKVPDLMKPTVLQTSAAHPPFIDLVPLPQVRDALMRIPVNFATALEAAGTSVSWNEPIEAAVVFDPELQKRVVTDKFEQHISEVLNYRFGRRLLDLFPDLDGIVNISAEDFIHPNTMLID